MTDSISITEQLAISVRAESLRVKRHFDFANGSIDLDLNFTVPNGQDLTVGQIDAASIRVALQHLQLMLDRAEAVAVLAPPATSLPSSPSNL